MNEERTLFFPKSHSIEKVEGIYGYLMQKLVLKRNLFRLDYKGILEPPLEFWKEFYSHLPSEIFEKVFNSYAYKNKGRIAPAVITGKKIITLVKNISGPTRFEDNLGKSTIREVFGPYGLPDTIVHASDLEGVGKDFEISEKYNLI